MQVVLTNQNETNGATTKLSFKMQVESPVIEGDIF